jgi:hypothetical protein
MCKVMKLDIFYFLFFIFFFFASVASIFKPHLPTDTLIMAYHVRFGYISLMYFVGNSIIDMFAKYGKIGWTKISYKLVCSQFVQTSMKK